MKSLHASAHVPLRAIGRAGPFRTWLCCSILSMGAVLSVAIPAFAAGPVRVAHAEAELVSEWDAVVPGQTFTLALRIKHDPDWHTSWQDTPFELEMPEGFVAGPLLWPAPEMADHAGTRLYSQSGEVFIPVAITAPASLEPGTTVEFATAVELWTWKDSEETVTEIELTIRLPVAAVRGQDPKWGPLLRKASAAAPASSPELAVTGYRQGDKIILVVNATRDLNPQADKFYFFEEQGLLEIGYNYTEWRSRRQVRISLREPEPDPKPDRLTGVLQAKGGWFKDGAEMHAVDFAVVDGPPPPTVPLGTLASAVLRNLDADPNYRQLRALSARDQGEDGVKPRYARRMLETLERLRTEAASVTTVDPEHPEKREVNFIESSGRVARLSALIPRLVDDDESYHDNAAVIICSVILEQADYDGLLIIPPLPPPPPVAKEAIARGISAVRHQDYSLAIRCFEEARVAAPNAPEVYFNLGLAESKRPGRELRAIAWFGAYLTSHPYAPAPNAAAVLEQMNVLFEKSRVNLATWLRSLQDGAARLPPEEGAVRLFQTVILWADAGEIAAAQKAAALIPAADDDYCFSLYEIVKAQLKAGDISGAQATAAVIQQRYALAAAPTMAASSYAGPRTEVAYTLTTAQVDIAAAQILAGDRAAAKKSLAAAQRSAHLIGYTPYEALVQPVIAEGLIQAGELAEAKTILAAAQKIGETNPETDAKIRGLLAIARIQLQADDAAGAARTFALAAAVTVPGNKNEIAREMAKAQAGGGDIAGAQATITLITDEADQDTARLAVVQAQIKRGDLAGGRATARTIKGPYDQSRARLAIVQGAENRGDARTDWLSVLREDDRIQDCPLDHAIFTDLAAYLKAQEKSQEPSWLFENLRTISQAQIRAQNAVGQMLAALAKK